ncbi:MAG: hypothetical protein HFF17_07100 [Oscillospiraceae bacterium]|nr:hypothetical protein [Oscillospiraceae bacterium]
MWYVLAGLAAGVLVGVAVAALLDAFWNDIAQWLNHTAAGAVKRVLGYDARKLMKRAIVRVSRLRDKLHNRAVIYTKRDAMDSFYTKVTADAGAPVYQVDKEILTKIENDGQMVNEFGYRG